MCVCVAGEDNYLRISSSSCTSGIGSEIEVGSRTRRKSRECQGLLQLLQLVAIKVAMRISTLLLPSFPLLLLQLSLSYLFVGGVDWGNSTHSDVLFYCGYSITETNWDSNLYLFFN